ncbi:MAG: thioredoxin family protein [Alphaproteobacteria bacterium]|nr:thioredoxin family protein [Alphaproteobacteria bacterium]
MQNPREVEIFSAGCPICQEAIALVESIACPSCRVVVHDLNDPGVLARASRLGVRSIPAIAIDGALVDCCVDRGPDEAALRAAGLGQPLP